MRCFVTCFVHYKTPLLTFGYWDNYAAAHIWVMNSPGIGPFARPYQFPYVHHYSLTQCIHHHSHNYITWVWIELNKSSEKFWGFFQSCLNRPTLFWYNYGWNCWTSWIVTWMFAILWQCYGTPILLYCFIISHYSSYCNKKPTFLWLDFQLPCIFICAAKWISIPSSWPELVGNVRCDFTSLQNQQWIGKL